MPPTSTSSSTPGSTPTPTSNLTMPPTSTTTSSTTPTPIPTPIPTPTMTPTMTMTQNNTQTVDTATSHRGPARPRLTGPWRRDLSPLSPTERRLARFALQLCQGTPELLDDRPGRDLAGALWPLLLPLLDPQALARWLAGERPRSNEEDEDPWSDDPPEENPRLRRRLIQALRHCPASVPRRLVAADDDRPLNPVTRLLGESLDLDALSLRVLDYLDLFLIDERLRQVMRQCGRTSARANRARLAAALGMGEHQLKARFGRQAPLRTLGLAQVETDDSDLEDYLRPSDLLREVFDAAPTSVDELLGLIIEPAPPAAWQLADFPHLARASADLGATLAAAARAGAAGVNALFYGEPGTGKTELARALAAAQGLRAFQVRSADEDGDGLSRQGRLSAYLLAQRLLSRRRDTLLIFDEVEDVFQSSDLLFALFRRRETGQQKGWINRTLEENPVPAIWITNSTDGMDPAFLRRFLLPLACGSPPRSVRRQMAERHLGTAGLDPDMLDELASDAALTPAQLAAAGRLLELRPEAPAEHTVRGGVAAIRTLLHGAPAPWRRPRTTRFDVAYLNLAGELNPSAIVQALDRRGRGSLCFYGPPGTGKTAFAEVLAEALDRELVARQASDLISKYVGETEQNLARLFRDADPRHSLLLLDEVDSFLMDRRQAQHSWERTQVNELLQQMERYPGIFIAATDLMGGLDPAALRRFDFKLHFRALTPAQRLGLFAREALGDEQAPVPPEWGRFLADLPASNSLNALTLLEKHLTGVNDIVMYIA